MITIDVFKLDRNHDYLSHYLVAHVFIMKQTHVCLGIIQRSRVFFRTHLQHNAWNFKPNMHK